MRLESSKSSTSAKSRKSERVTADRIRRDLADYERIKKRIEQALYHHSDGLWGWVEDATSTAWDWVNDAVDTVASYVAPVVDTVSGWVSDGWDWVNNQVDTYIWDTSADVAVVEGALKDGWNWVTGLFDGDESEVEDDIDEGNKGIIHTIIDTVKGGTREVIEPVWDWIKALKELIDQIKQLFGDFLEDALEAIIELPKLIYSLLTIDEDTFVEDAVKLTKLQAKLAEELKEVEG